MAVQDQEDKIIGTPPGGPSLAAMNRPKALWGTPLPPTDYAARGLPVTGEQNARTDIQTGVLQGSPLSPEEQQFWAAHPMGAAKDPISGNLIGLGSTPQSAKAVTDQIAARVEQPQLRPSADTSRFDELKDMAISARQRIENLKSQRADLQRQQQTTPMGKRGTLTPQGRAIASRLSATEHDIAQAASEEHMMSHQAAHEADQLLVRNKSITTANQYTQYAKALNDITAPAHSPEWEAAITKAMSDFPEGAMSVAGRERTGHMYSMETPSADQMRKAVEFAHSNNPNITGGQLTSKGGANVRFLTDQQVLKKDAETELKPLGLSPEMVQNPVAARVGRLDSKTGKFVKDSSGNLVALAGASKASNGEAYGLNKGDAVITMPLYLKHGGTLSPEDQAAQKGTAQITPAHPQDDAALNWARSNPNDPRAQQILKLNQ